MNVGLEISFVKNTIGGEYLIHLYDQFVRFAPRTITKKHTTKQWNEQRHRKVIENLKGGETLIISGTNSHLFVSMETGSNQPHHSIGIVQDKNVFLPTSAEIAVCFTPESFIVGYLFDEDYITIQNAVRPGNIDYRNFSSKILNSIKNTPYSFNEFDEKEYDTYNNPGRKFLISYCWLMTAWKMWFGNIFYKLVPKEKILSYPGDVYRIEELPDGKVFVQLFENIEESADPINMDRQIQWRKWLDFEGLMEKYPY